jgi:hypothetical protein
MSTGGGDGAYESVRDVVDLRIMVGKPRDWV